jgi:hypothetical protein
VLTFLWHSYPSSYLKFFISLAVLVLPRFSGNELACLSLIPAFVCYIVCSFSFTFLFFSTVSISHSFHPGFLWPLRVLDHQEVSHSRSPTSQNTWEMSHDVNTNIVGVQNARLLYHRNRRMFDLKTGNAVATLLLPSFCHKGICHSLGRRFIQSKTCTLQNIQEVLGRANHLLFLI